MYSISVAALLATLSFLLLQQLFHHLLPSYFSTPDSRSRSFNFHLCSSTPLQSSDCSSSEQQLYTLYPLKQIGVSVDTLDAQCSSSLPSIKSSGIAAFPLRQQLQIYRRA